MNHPYLKCAQIGLLCLGLCAFGMLWPLPSHAGRVLNDALVTRPFRHHVWQEILTNWVNSAGEVDFAKMRAFPRRINEYLDQLATVSPDSDASYFPTKEDKAAYWINAHNAVAMRIILDHYPVTSLAQVQNLETNPRYKLGNRAYTLREIRAKAISYRKYPHILFSLTNYSMDAPPLIPRAYEGNTLKTLTRQAMQKTLADKHLIAFERTGPSCVCLSLSPYFHGYEQILFSPPAYEAEDRDEIAAMGRNFHNISHIKLVGHVNWTDTMRVYAPPAMYADLGHACSQQVRFTRANKTLRQVRHEPTRGQRLNQ